ncbi:hypothetical protein CRE_30582 [Caenorhabditis remanei]|uniref:Uncharacterized protein n=1 Tax=Caenorhabditis remanei TaxID=31234 RepID=E3NQ99_CAERE|nr:hypothetical protein CRE_30582 [Caenorhabditis remanei]
MFGPFCTGIFLFLALWGTVFMAVLGGLFYNQSVGLFEDLPKEGKSMESKPWKDRVNNFDNLYQQNAYNWLGSLVESTSEIAVLLSLRGFAASLNDKLLNPTLRLKFRPGLLLFHFLNIQVCLVSFYVHL